MRPDGGGPLSGSVAKAIDADLSGYERFVEEFEQAAATQFGSGWVWLVLDEGKLKVTKTHDADLPLVKGPIHSRFSIDHFRTLIPEMSNSSVVFGIARPS
jgi:superoxide dismutase, Fe-Mn family